MKASVNSLSRGQEAVVNCGEATRTSIPEYEARKMTPEEQDQKFGQKERVKYHESVAMRGGM